MILSRIDTRLNEALRQIHEAQRQLSGLAVVDYACYVRLRGLAKQLAEIHVGDSDVVGDMARATLALLDVT